MIHGRRFNSVSLKGSPEAGSVNDTFALDDIILKVNSVDNVALAKGSKVKFNFTVVSSSGLNYKAYEIDSLNAPIGPEIFPIINADDTDEHFELVQTGSVGFALIQKNVAGSSYEITYSTQICRKIPTDFIDDPITLLEYIKRAQDWSENSDIPLICTTGEGSFDDAELATVKALKIAWQILDYDQAFTDVITQKICETFFLCSYQDNNGYECVKSILGTETPSDNLTLLDVVPDSIGQVQEPQPRDIFVEPFVNYSFDQATEKHLNILAIKNVTTQADWTSDCTPGFTADEGQALWYACKRLWTKYKHYEKIPSSMTDLEMVPDYETAKWVLTNRIGWMGKKRLSFAVFYDTAKDWNPGRHITINFPHQTNGFTIECIVEKISKSKNKNKITLTVVLIDEIPNSFFSTVIQETPGAEVVIQETPGAEAVYQEQKNQ